MNGLRLQKTSDTTLCLVNWTTIIITREKEATGLDGVEHFLVFSPVFGSAEIWLSKSCVLAQHCLVVTS